ncbi:sequence-specific DNA binding RNA polymerase II transcription factor [Ascochyta rabiei]|uniref:Sequence-specific DNA binding RNA polymerase II transcription factor n=1 Tax=Didymella rabiei TaxID=5454 RepID=A0A163BGR4_DIDRA|nr:sequence-specific DNA binding RNA polymerase II transcription factor [Ascochyta rabiei]
MKLACLRCERKKVKCDKDDPACHQCVTAKSGCQYVERRQRPRLAQHRVAVTSLSKRLELLEKQISNDGSRLESAQQRSPSVSTSLAGSTPDPIDPGAANIVAESSPSVVFQAPENAQDSWIFRMANDTKRCFQSQATPTSTPTPQVDTVMSALNDALEDLGKLKCIEAFIDMMNTLVIPDIFTTALDVDLLRTLPSINGSPYVKVDSGLHVMYFAALHYGLPQTRGHEHLLTQAAYLKALEHVPAWLDTSTETDMDGYTAAMTCWVAINNLDYQLSWKFHCKSCHYLESKGIDNLDITPARTVEEEEKRESLRYLY